MNRFPIRFSRTTAAMAVAAFMLGAPPASSASSVAGISAPGVPGSPDGATTRAITADSADFLTLDLMTYGEDLRCGVIDPAAGYAYFGTYTSLPKIIKVRLATATSPAAQVGVLNLPPSDTFLVMAMIDPVAGYAYFGPERGHLVKIALGDGDGPPVRIGSVDVTSLDYQYLSNLRITGGVIDPANGFCYVGAVTELFVPQGQPYSVPAAARPVPAAPTSSQGRGYYQSGTYYDYTNVVKVALGSGDSLPSVVGYAHAYTEYGDSALGGRSSFRLRGGILDPASGKAYFGMAAENPVDSLAARHTVVKVAVGTGSVAPAVVSSLTLEPGDMTGAGAFDAAGGHLFFGMGRRVVKIAPGIGNSPPARVDSMDIPADSTSVHGAAFDPVSGYAYLGAAGTSAVPGSALQVDLGSPEASPTTLGSVPLESGNTQFPTVLLDSMRGFAYFAGTDNRIRILSTRPATPLRMTRVTLTEPASVGQMRFYSHRAAGNLRFSVYDDSPVRRLLWRSGSVRNTVAGGVVTVPVTSGSPEFLTLAAGTYHLAWQADTGVAVASHTPGEAGTGFTLADVRFGDEPATIATATSGVVTTENYTQTITYEPLISRLDVLHGFDPAGGGAPAGFATLTQLGAGSAVEYDATGTALVARVQAGPGFRVAGWFGLARSTWLPVSAVGPDRIARARFTVHAAGQTDPSAANSIPNMRFRIASRFAVNSMVEVLHHYNADPGNTALAAELRPSADPARPSRYTVDLDPVDVPYYAVDPTEGFLAGFEAYGTAADPQDNGAIVVSEITLGSYPKSFVPDSAAPARVMAAGPGGGDFGPAGASTQAFNAQGPGNTVDDPPGLLGTADLTDTGTVLSTANVPADRIGVVARDFPVGLDASPANRIRVEPGRQYHVRFHLTSTQATSLNGQITMKARGAKFAYVHKLQVGGGSPTNNVAGQTIARQALPGPGGANPDNDGAADAGRGGWYNLVFRTPLDPDIRADGPAGATIGQLMPTFLAEPGPGNPTPGSRRDLRVGLDLIDTLDSGAGAADEVGQVAVDRIEFRSYPAVEN